MSSLSRLFLVIVLITTCAVAQELPPGIPVIPAAPVPPENEMKDLQPVYVRDSGVASEKLALAERMERLKEWDKSGNVYQEITEKYADRVIPTRSDETGQVSQYTSVALVVQERLAKWPEEGLAIYRSRYEDAAREALDRAQSDRSELQRVFSRYFATESGKSAGLRLVSLGLERGEFSSSAWVGRRLLAYHPLLLIERPKVLFQTAIAEHLAGNDTGAAQRLVELKQKFPNAAGTLRGQDVILADALEKELAQPFSLARAFRSDAWPVPFGNFEASAVPEQVCFGGARMFSIELPRPGTRRGVSEREMEAQLGPQRKLGGQTGILPAVDNGELFFQDNARVYAINLSSGLPLAGWLQTYPGDKRGAFSIDAVPTPRGKPLGVCVNSKSVLAILGQNDLVAASQFNVNAVQQAQLVCLDRNNGKRIWSTLMQKIKLPDDQGNLRESQFYGLPLVVDDSVYVLARANRGGQFEECYLVCLKLSDGSFRWASYVASTSSGMGMAMAFDSEPFGESSTALLCYSDARVYVLTNLGAAACLDAGDGKTLWLNIYPRKTLAAGRGRVRQFINPPQNAVRPFAQNPPMIVDGRLFVAPTDSPYILAYDAASGEEVRRIPRALERGKYEPADMLLGVVGDQMVLGNRSMIFVIPWQNYDPSKPLIANGAKYRHFRSEGEEPNEDDSIRGRPLVSSKYIFVPTAGNLYRVGLDEFFRIEGVHPPKGVWDEAEESPGNVLATPDYLIVAGQNRVTVYADLAVATRKLDDLIARDPSAVEPHLRYAELLLAGGKPRDAIDWLDKAIERLGGRRALARGPMRDRLFEIACGFGSKFQRTDGASPEVIRQLFERARDSADTAQQQVRYRMAHALFLRKISDPASEIALHQQILSQPEWRGVSIAGRAGAGSAGAEAEASISELVVKDPSLYAPWDTEAARKMESLQHLQPPARPEMFAEIAEVYPLSNSAQPALQTAATMFEQAGQLRQSNQALRRLLKRASSANVRATTLESLARNYTQLPNQIDLAIVRLDQAAKIDSTRKLSKPLVLGEQTLEQKTLEEACSLLKLHRTLISGKSLPSLHLPSGAAAPNNAPFRPAEALEGVSAIVRQQEDAGRADRVVALKTDLGLIQFDAGSIQPLHAPLRLDEPPIGCAYSGDALIVVTPQGVSALSGSTGQPLWRARLSNLPGAELTADTRGSDAEEDDDDDSDVTDNDMINELAEQRRMPPARVRQIIRGRGLARIVAGNALMPVPGVDRMENPDTGPERIVHFRVLSDRVVVATTTSRVISFDLVNGNADWQTRPADMPIRHFLAIDDFVVVAGADQINSSEVMVLDALTGQIIGRASYLANQGRQLVNLALSRDGVLVTMLMNELSARDLFDTQPTLWRKNVGNRNNGEMPFITATNPEQLVITDGRVLAVAVSNDRQASVRAYDLRTGEPVKSQDPRSGRFLEAVYPSGASVSNEDREVPALSIRAVGPVFYITGPKSLAAYHLDKAWQWIGGLKGDLGPSRGFFIAQDYCLLLSQSSAVANANAVKLPAMQFSIYSRSQLDNGAESGLLEYRPTVRDPSNILVGNWQLANGAFYYVSGDQKLKMLKSNK